MRRLSRQSPYCGLRPCDEFRRGHRAGPPQLRGAGGAQSPPDVDARCADRGDRLAEADRCPAAAYADRPRLCRACVARAGLPTHGARAGSRGLDPVRRSPRGRRHSAHEPLHVGAWLAALSRDLELRRHLDSPFHRAGKPDVVRGSGPELAPAGADQRARPGLARFLSGGGAADHPARHRRAHAAPGNRTRRGARAHTT